MPRGDGIVIDAIATALAQLVPILASSAAGWFARDAYLDWCWKRDRRSPEIHALRSVFGVPAEPEWIDNTDRIAVVMEFSGNTTTRFGRPAPRPDLSNLVKNLEDTGNGVLWDDDRQIRTWRVPYDWEREGL